MRSVRYLPSVCEAIAAAFAGPFLSDLYLPRCTAFEAWRVYCSNETEILRLKALRALDRSLRRRAGAGACLRALAAIAAPGRGSRERDRPHQRSCPPDRRRPPEPGQFNGDPCRSACEGTGDGRASKHRAGRPPPWASRPARSGYATLKPATARGSPTPSADPGRRSCEPRTGCRISISTGRVRYGAIGSTRCPAASRSSAMTGA